MDCSKIIELIPQYLRGELDEKTRISFEEHCAACPACQFSLEQEETIIRLMRTSSVQEPSDEYWDDYNSKVTPWMSVSSEHPIYENPIPLHMDKGRTRNRVVFLIMAGLFLVGMTFVLLLHSWQIGNFFAMWILWIGVAARRHFVAGRAQMALGKRQREYHETQNEPIRDLIETVDFVQACIYSSGVALIYGISGARLQAFQKSVLMRMHSESVYLFPMHSGFELSLLSGIGVFSLILLFIEIATGIVLKLGYLKAFAEYHRLGQRNRYTWSVAAVLSIMASILLFNSYVGLSDRGIVVRHPWSISEEVHTWTEVRKTEKIVADNPDKWRVTFSDGGTITINHRYDELIDRGVINYAHTHMQNARRK